MFMESIHSDLELSRFWVLGVSCDHVRLRFHEFKKTDNCFDDKNVELTTQIEHQFFEIVIST